MYVKISMSNSDTFEIESMDDEEAMSLAEEWAQSLRRTDGSEVLALTMGEPPTIVRLNASQVSSIELA